MRLAAVYAAKTDLVLDEAQYWTWSRELAFGYFSKPPMIAWVIRGISEICGNSEACVRSASPILYTIVSVVIFFTARALYDARVGFWSAIIFATLPGVSYSSLLITTDVPLILCWSIMLYAWVMLVKRQSLGYAILLGVAIGFGLLAKQAMLYVFLCIGVHAAVSKDARDALRGGRGILAAAIALLLFAPNVIWNAQHGFPTVKHTETNIGWQYPYIHPLRVLEYVSVQFAVFGPILLVVLLRTAWRELPKPGDPRQDASVLLLAAGARASRHSGAALPRARQLVGDRLSCRVDSRHRGHARAQPGDIVQGFARLASCLRGDRRGRAGLRRKVAAVRAVSVPRTRGRLARIGRYRAREIGRAALRLDPGRYAGDGGRAALLSSRRADPALCVAARVPRRTIITR